MGDGTHNLLRKMVDDCIMLRLQIPSTISIECLGLPSLGALLSKPAIAFVNFEHGKAFLLRVVQRAHNRSQDVARQWGKVQFPVHRTFSCH